jgi:neuronal calcium sensor 1
VPLIAAFFCSVSDKRKPLRYKGFLKDCPSGQLDKTQFKRIYQQFFPSGDASEFAEYAFHAFDKNESGTIDFKDFICALSITGRGRLDEKLECKFLEASNLLKSGKLILCRILSGAFRLYDIDKDGFVTYDEMLRIVQSIYKMAGPTVKLEDTPEKVRQ